MKKYFSIFAALCLLAFSSCNKVDVQLTEEHSPESYTFNFNISGAGFEPTTKADATIGWTAGESVYVFFYQDENLDMFLPGYLKLTYNSDGSWSQSTVGINDGDLGDSGWLAAIYVPFLGSVQPEYTRYGWSFNAPDVYFSCAEDVSYTVIDNEVCATIEMAIPDGYVQFCIPDEYASEGDVLTCVGVSSGYTPIEASVNYSGAITASSNGNPMIGHALGNIVYFYGKISKSELSSLEFLLFHDGKTYIYTPAPEKSISKNNSYSIKLFTEYDDEPVPVPYTGALPGVYSVSATDKVYFSQGNLWCKAEGGVAVNLGSNNSIISIDATGPFTFGFEEEQWEYHLRPDIKWSYSTPSEDQLKGLKNDTNVSGLFQHIVKYDGTHYGAFGYGKIVTPTDPTVVLQWGEAMGEGWHNMNAAEADYLLNKRPNAAFLQTVGYVNGAKCVLLAPDYEDGTLTEWQYQRNFTAEEWEVAENKYMLVCIPAIGEGHYAYYTSSLLGDSAYYWLSDAKYTDGYYNLFAYSTGSYEQQAEVSALSGMWPCPVRLVHPIE